METNDCLLNTVMASFSQNRPEKSFIELKGLPRKELGYIVKRKRRELKIPTMDKIKTDKVLKKLKLKLGKDYDMGYGDRNTFLLDVDVKHLDKVITYLMQNRIRVN